MSARDLERISEIDSSDECQAIYLQHGTELVLVRDTHSTRRRRACEWAGEISLWKSFLNDGGAAFGAFEDEKLVGFSVIRTRLTQVAAQLAGLYVDRDSRRRGVASSLVGRSVIAAKWSGAKTLYVSATRTETTISFYLRLGFRPVAQPHPELYELEPYDIHMSLDLTESWGNPQVGAS